MKTSTFLLGVTVLAVSRLEAFLPTNLAPRTRCHKTSFFVVTESRLASIPEPLASEGDWTAYLDEDTTGLVYYFNGKTGESMWEPPTKSFPVVVLPRQMRRTAEMKRSEYIRSLKDREARKNFPESDTARNQKEADKKREERERKDKEDDDNWFDFLFEDEPEPEPTWFESVSSALQKQEPEIDGTDKKQSEPVKGKESVIESPTAVEEPPSGAGSKSEVVVEEDKQTEKKPGLFERLTVSKQPPSSGAVETSKPEVELTKTVEKKPAIRPSISFPLSFGTTVQPAEPVVTTEPVVKPIKIEVASCVLPHPAKMFWGGEDAVFTAGRTFGVFDGVTGAKKLDGVPLYSKTLASEMRKFSKSNDLQSKGMSIVEMQRYLTKAKEVADVSSTGASTAIVASISQDGFLRALNVGDSTCLVIRKGKVAARTRESSHYFDCPYQLSLDSPDLPRDGTRINIELVNGDIIVMGTDGVFDNLDESEIVELVKGSQEKNSKLSVLAKQIADRSRRVSLNRTAATPYAKLAKRNGDPDFGAGVGGKLDDVSCVVVRYG